MQNGKFIISLDFELFWGVRDSRSIAAYGENIKGVHSVIPQLLDAFQRYNIHSTFAIVGFLFFENKKELLSNLPSVLPNYKNSNFSPYNGYFELIGNDFKTDPCHYAPQLIKLIQQHPQHEIASHTFSHYYCLEKGQTVADFKADIENAKRTAEKWGISVTSLVFPRNQFTHEYLEVCKELNFICYRGNERSWIYKVQTEESGNYIRKGFKLLDTYINISGYHCYSDEYLIAAYPINIPSSRFLRPYSEKLKLFDKFRLKRIKKSMTHAAKNNLTYHLWWHPHNFGINQQENFAFLEDILKHYNELETSYNFKSYTMSELANAIKNGGKENYTISR